MKKIFMAIALCLVCATTINAQLVTKSIAEARKYTTVCEYSVMTVCFGEIRYTSDGFILFGVTNNRFENSMASIFLGLTKEEALLTVEDLHKILQNKEMKEFVVKGFDNKNTTVYKSFGTYFIETEGIAGASDILSYLKLKITKTKESIQNFNIPE